VNPLRVAITGATGLLGRNLVFEIVKQRWPHLDQLEIFVLGRADGSTSLQSRMEEILRTDGADYLEVRQAAREGFAASVSRIFKYVDFRCGAGPLEIAPAELTELQSRPIDWFFHIAGHIDLRASPAAVTKLRCINVGGTRKVLDLVSRLRIGQFCYVGTAYACGSAAGTIQPDSVYPSERFRNPYERSKLDAEILVRQFARRTGVCCRYFRPSTICGRLLEPPWGAISKFDVFYAWAAFFLRCKLAKAATHAGRDGCDLEARVAYRQDGGLNIVPVDYAAKMMYQICEQNHPGESYHLVNDKITPHNFYIPQMLRAVGVAGVSQADRIPEDKNSLERLYYKSVGSVYTPYITCDAMHFDVSNLETVTRQAGLQCPAIDEAAFEKLMDYAMKYNFGRAASLGRGLRQ
jgi:nucleoside-diphosphate-sugar epimerase